MKIYLADQREQENLASFTRTLQKKIYKQTIDRMISYIVEGDIYIANIDQQLR